MPEREPKRSKLRQILEERPEARPRLSQAVVSLLAASVVSIGVMGALLIWHLVRRGRLIRQRLHPPRPVRWPAIKPAGPDAPPPAADDINRQES